MDLEDIARLVGIGIAVIWVAAILTLIITAIIWLWRHMVAFLSGLAL